MSDPDYSRILTQARCVAHTYGWAITLHGSGTRDLDLVMVPWTDEAVNEPEAIVRKIASVTGTTITREPEIKPHGRMGWALFVDEVRFVDLSVMLCVKKPAAQALCGHCGVDRLKGACTTHPCKFGAESWQGVRFGSGQ